MTGFAGTGQLTRLAFRRDMVVLPACVFWIAALLAITARDLKALYPTAAVRLAVATSAGENPALRFLLGRLNGTSVGAFAAARWGVWGPAFAVLLTILIVVRHTRADEEAGRLELVGSAAVGRQAPLTAALLAAAAANVALALLTCLWLSVLKLPLAGSAALALSIAGCGLVFAGLAAVGAQLAVTARGARGIAIAVLGAAFVLRAVGDSGPAGLSWLSWASPLGWVELTRAFGSAGERWQVLALPLAASAVLLTAAFALAAWRDHSAGLLPGRPGRPAASGLLRGPSGLAWRLQRGVLAAWLAGYVLIFTACGAAATGVGSILGASAELRRYLLREGYQATLIHAYLSALMLLAGLAAAVYATSAVLGLRAEETGNLAEPVLATVTGRIRWGLSHIWVAAGGACLLLAAAGLSARPGLRHPHRSGQHAGAAAARRRGGPAARGAGPGGGGCLAVRAAAVGVHRAGMERGSARRGDRGVRPAAAVASVDDGHLAVHPDPQAARRYGVSGAAAVALRHRAGPDRGRPGGLRRRDLGDLGPSRLTGSVLSRLADYVQESNQISPAGGGTAQPPANN